MEPAYTSAFPLGFGPMRLWTSPTGTWATCRRNALTLKNQPTTAEFASRNGDIIWASNIYIYIILYNYIYILYIYIYRIYYGNLLIWIHQSTENWPAESGTHGTDGVYVWWSGRSLPQTPLVNKMAMAIPMAMMGRLKKQNMGFGSVMMDTLW